MTAVMFGSITQRPRTGNPGDNFYYDEHSDCSVNALGIPNKGIDGYPELPAVASAVRGSGAHAWVSVSAGDRFDEHEYGAMAHRLDRDDAADVIEGNFSCGNMVLPDGSRKPIVCYDFDEFDAGVGALVAGAGKRKTAAKLTPLSEPSILHKNVALCLQHEVDYIVMANTVPNCYFALDGKPAIAMVRGGMGGRGVRPIIKGMLLMAAPQVKGTKTKLIATGGVGCGADAYEYLALGAQGFQCNTALTRRHNDPRVMQEIICGSDGAPGLVDLLVEHGLPD